MTERRSRIIFTVYVLIVLMIGWFVLSCGKEPSELPEFPLPEEQTVQLQLFTDFSDYDLPASRANETAYGKEPMVVVFKGTGNTAVFAQAKRAVFNGVHSVVTLNRINSPVTLLIIANLDDTDFFNGSTPFNEANIALALDGKTLGEINTQGLFRTASLPAETITTLPYSGTTQTMPMTAVYEMPSITSDLSIGAPGNSLRLIRALAKVTVEVKPELNDFFELKAVGVVNAPRSRSLYYTAGSPIDNTGNLTRYGSETAGMAQATLISGVYTTLNNPIYLYESQADQGTALIVQGAVENVDKFFVLPFHDRNGYMDIRRNTHYIFRVIGVGNGFDTMDEAINASGFPDFKYEVIVKEKDAYDVVSDGKIFIGTSSSAIDLIVRDTHTARITVYTNATAAGGYTTAITADPGITVTPATITFATASVPTETTDVDIKIDASVTRGYVLLRIGALTKEIEVVRHNDRQVVSGAPLELPYADYIIGQSQDTGWLFVSNDGVNPVTRLEKDAPGKMYVLTTGKGSQVGEILAVRSRTGRSSIYVKRPQ